MKKKNLGRIAAAGLAAMTAVSAMGVTASATEIDSNGRISGYVYKVVENVGGGTDENGKPIPVTPKVTYYDQAPSDVSYTTESVTTAFGYGATIYYQIVNGQTVVSNRKPASGSYSSGVTIGYGNTTPTPGGSSSLAASNNAIYRGATDGLWYPNLSSLRAAGNTSYSQTLTLTGSQTYGSVRNAYGSDNIYFNQISGSYEFGVPNVANYIKITGYDSSNNNYYGYTYGVYKVGTLYYPTYNSALSAAGGDASKVYTSQSLTAPTYNYFNRLTGKYYPTYAAAASASSGNTSYVVSLGYYNNNNYYYDDWYYGYGYGYDDPYYYYWLERQKEKNDDTTSSKNDSTTATVGNRKGWTAVAKYLSSLKNGSSVSVSMNYETSIPSSVTSAIYGKNITVKFVLKNGVVFAINGKDLSTTSSIDIDTTYNTDMVPTKLIKAAYKKNDAVSNAQITISGGSFGVDADVTVKFSTKRAGCTAKLYRYNSAKETLSLVDTAKVQSNGKCTFGDVDKGGNFVIILC